MIMTLLNYLRLKLLYFVNYLLNFSDLPIVHGNNCGVFFVDLFSSFTRIVKIRYFEMSHTFLFTDQFYKNDVLLHVFTRL